MKKTLKTQLAAALSMLLVAAVALTGATYAWFTGTGSAEVGNLELYVKAQGNLQLSSHFAPAPYDNDWSILISQEDIANNQDNQVDGVGTGKTVFPTKPEYLYHASSAFNATTAGKFFIPDTTGYQQAMSQISADKYNWIKFDLSVKSTDTGVIYLTSDSQVALTEAMLAAILAQYDSNGTLAAADPRNSLPASIRIGFVPYIMEKGDDDYNVPSDDYDLSWDHAVIWEPLARNHLDQKFGGPGADADHSYNMKTYAVTDPSSETNFGLFAETNAPINAQNSFFFTSDYAAPANGTQTNKDGKAFTPSGDTNRVNQINLFNYTASDSGSPVIQRFAVYIWIEGQDYDTLNAITGTDFFTNLQFAQGAANISAAGLYEAVAIV